MSLDWILFSLRIVSTVILYTFLVFAFYILWADLKQTAGRMPPEQPDTAYQLRVVAAAGDNSPAIGDTLTLQPETVLGDAADSTFVLSDASIPARHARLSRRQGVWWLEAQGSQAGIRLNDLLLSRPTPVRDGDIIKMGDLAFRLEPVSAATLNPPGSE